MAVQLNTTILQFTKPLEYAVHNYVQFRGSPIAKFNNIVQKKLGVGPELYANTEDAENYKKMHVGGGLY
jgi:hypothetical protein